MKNINTILMHTVKFYIITHALYCCELDTDTISLTVATIVNNMGSLDMILVKM